jgi:hypothetical protein
MTHIGERILSLVQQLEPIISKENFDENSKLDSLSR